MKNTETTTSRNSGAPVTVDELVQAAKSPASCMKIHPELSAKALHGIAGEITREVSANSEASQAALLASVMSFASAHFGANAFTMVGDSKHPPRISVTIVGASSRARKGTSTAPIRRVFGLAKKYCSDADIRVSNGPATSGEGLIYNVRDASDEEDKDGKLIDAGVADKRLLILEGEFGAVLQAMLRQGNTLSSILRNAWDDGNLEPLTKTNRIKATGAHIVMLGHITQDELLAKLPADAIYNGLVNRILWVCARRPKMIAIPFAMDNTKVDGFAKRIAAAIEYAQSIQEPVTMSEECKALWIEMYPRLSKDIPGVLGAVTSRAEPQVLRLALIYCLLDLSARIQPEHLIAAAALWQYASDSARFIFGGITADPESNRVLLELSKSEMTQTQLNDVFSGHMSSADLRKILSGLEGSGRVSQRREGGGRGKGKATTYWHITPGFELSSAELAEEAE